MPPKASGKGAARQWKPGYCPQNAATACGKGAAEDSTAPRMHPQPVARALRRIRRQAPSWRWAAKGARTRLRAGYCLLSTLFLGRAPPAICWGRRIYGKKNNI